MNGTTVLVQVLAQLAAQMLQASNLLTQTRAENRDPSPAELQALDVLDDAKRAELQAAIDAAGDHAFGKVAS